MPFIYPQVTTLERAKKVGTTQCVALVQSYARAPHTGSWKAGESVLGSKNIRPGTAIATFVNGRYPSRPHGNHAALFLRFAADGFWVMDQWKDDRPEPENKKPYISSRLIRPKGLKQHADGTWPQASDNADAYSIIELR